MRISWDIWCVSEHGALTPNVWQSNGKPMIHVFFVDPTSSAWWFQERYLNIQSSSEKNKILIQRYPK